MTKDTCAYSNVANIYSVKYRFSQSYIKLITKKVCRDHRFVDMKNTDYTSNTFWSYSKNEFVYDYSNNSGTIG